MKCHYIKAVLVLLLSLQFAALHAVPDNQKGTNCSQKSGTLQKPASPAEPAFANRPIIESSCSLDRCREIAFTT